MRKLKDKNKKRKAREKASDTEDDNSQEEPPFSPINENEENTFYFEGIEDESYLDLPTTPNNQVNVDDNSNSYEEFSSNFVENFNLSSIVGPVLENISLVSNNNVEESNLFEGINQTFTTASFSKQIITFLTEKNQPIFVLILTKRTM